MIVHGQRVQDRAWRLVYIVMVLKLDPTLGVGPSSTNSVRSMKNESLLPSTAFSSIGLVGPRLRFLSADTVALIYRHIIYPAGGGSSMVFGVEKDRARCYASCYHQVKSMDVVKRSLNVSDARSHRLFRNFVINRSIWANLVVLCLVFVVFYEYSGFFEIFNFIFEKIYE